MRKLENKELGRVNEEAYEVLEKLAVTVVLDNLRSAQNIGSFFRTSDAFKIERLLLCGISATPPSRDIHKSALGAELSVRWEYRATTVEAVEQLKAEGYSIIAIEQVEDATMLSDFEVEQNKKYALIFGNELKGVAQDVVDLCHHCIEIPQSGTKHSLNVSVAGGVVLWHFYQHLEKTEK